MSLAYIEGTIKNKHENKFVIVTDSGVGFEVYSCKNYIVGSSVQMYLTQIIRENSQDLFGFERFEEKKFYELLLNVKGIGPKTAFVLLTTLGVLKVKNAIICSDKKLLQSVPGIGTKAAAQIVLDLGNKIPNWSLSLDEVGSDVAQDVLPSTDIVDEAIMAFKELGFKEDKIKPAISQVLATQNFKKAEDLVASVLKTI